jgi:hypothetical protein
MLIHLLFDHFSWSKIIYYFMTLMDVGQDRAESIATRYGLDGPGIKSQWGLDFLYLS